MMKDDELWLKKIKERLDDYSEPLPDTGWERLEKVLPASAPMSVGKKKQVMFRRWAMTAAAVVLVAVSSVSLWLLQSPVVDEVSESEAGLQCRYSCDGRFIEFWQSASRII